MKHLVMIDGYVVDVSKISMVSKCGVMKVKNEKGEPVSIYGFAMIVDTVEMPISEFGESSERIDYLRKNLLKQMGWEDVAEIPPVTPERMIPPVTPEKAG